MKDRFANDVKEQSASVSQQRRMQQLIDFFIKRNVLNVVDCYLFFSSVSLQKHKKKENINIDYAKVRILSKSDVIRFTDKTSISTYYCMVEV